jgi:NADPH:quinone reductase-like Zn-dependent oxidoreductase
MERRLLQMNGNKGVHAAFDFVGGDMKRLCSNIVDFDGHVISIVSEGANFTLDEDRYGEHPLFAKSASFHYVLLYARAVFGEPEMWRMYQQRLDTLRGLFEEEHLPPPVVTDMGKFSVNTVQDAHRQLEGGHVQGKLVMHVD